MSKKGLEECGIWGEKCPLILEKCRIRYENCIKEVAPVCLQSNVEQMPDCPSIRVASNRSCRDAWAQETNHRCRPTCIGIQKTCRGLANVVAREMAFRRHSMEDTYYVRQDLENESWMCHRLVVNIWNSYSSSRFEIGLQFHRTTSPNKHLFLTTVLLSPNRISSTTTAPDQQYRSAESDSGFFVHPEGELAGRFVSFQAVFAPCLVIIRTAAWSNGGDYWGKESASPRRPRLWFCCLPAHFVRRVAPASYFSDLPANTSKASNWSTRTLWAD